MPRERRGTWSCVLFPPQLPISYRFFFLEGLSTPAPRVKCPAGSGPRSGLCRQLGAGAQHKHNLRQEAAAAVSVDPPPRAIAAGGGGRPEVLRAMLRAGLGWGQASLELPRVWTDPLEERLCSSRTREWKPRHRTRTSSSATRLSVNPRTREGACAWGEERGLPEPDHTPREAGGEESRRDRGPLLCQPHKPKPGWSLGPRAGRRPDPMTARYNMLINRPFKSPGKDKKAAGSSWENNG